MLMCVDKKPKPWTNSSCEHPITVFNFHFCINIYRLTTRAPTKDGPPFPSSSRLMRADVPRASLLSDPFGVDPDVSDSVALLFNIGDLQKTSKDTWLLCPVTRHLFCGRLPLPFSYTLFNSKEPFVGLAG